MSLFRKKKSSSKTSKSTPPDATPFNSLSPITSHRLSPLPTAHSSYDIPQLHVDDFGRPIEPMPAFSTGTGASAVPFGSGYGIGEEEEREMQLLYGYTPLSTQLGLSVIKCEEVVARCAAEIRQKGLDTPLIMSSMALDLSLEGVCSLIRSYTDSPQTWPHDLTLATPLAVGTFLKWALGRLINDRGGRGFVSWDLYNEFKTAERATGYQSRSCTVHLVSRLSAANGRLLSTLLSFFSSVAAHSAKNGMPPRKLAALFSPYVFGLADDCDFDETYQKWQRATDALEHILLSYVRNQQADAALPTFLERFIVGYPATLNVSYQAGAKPKIPKGARVEEVTRFKRLTRFHSRNLIQQSASWEVQHSSSWNLFFDPSNPSSTPIYTASYRHLLNIRSNHNLEDGEYLDQGEMQKYKTGIEKEWSKFGELGFSDVDCKKLEFDLTEGERAQVVQKRDTLDWSTFESAGFSGREIFAPTDLVFHHTLGQRVNTWPNSQKALAAKLRATEELLPPFPYDTVAREEGRILVEKDFFEAWADVLVGGGWARDELKESSFALIAWKARPREGELPKGKRVGNDPRTEDRWVCVEEWVPREYRDALLSRPQTKKQSKRVSFMRAVRRRSTQKVPPSPTSATRPSVSGQPSFATRVPSSLSSSYLRKDSGGLRPIDEAVFQPGTPYETQHLSLSNLNAERRSYAPSTSYAPSVVSTVRAADGHGPAFSTTDLPAANQHCPPPMPPPASPGRGMGVGGTFSSQTRESAFGGQGVPAALGYTKPPPVEAKRSFLSRIGTMRPGKGSGGSPVAATAPEVLAAAYEPAPVQVASPPRSSPQPPQPRQLPQPPQSRPPPTPPQPPQPQPRYSSPSPQLVSNGVVSPAHEGHHNGVLPGAPPLGLIRARPEATPPLPPKEYPIRENGAMPSPEPLHSASRSTVNLASSVSDDAYGGMDELEVDEDGVEVGEVLFRGSQSFPRDLSVQAGGQSRESDQPVDGQHAVSPPRRVPNPASLSPSQRPPRSHSLHPDAELPVDEPDPRFPHQDERYLSGVSQFSSRVANIVGLYEQRDTMVQPDVRLTQYGFTQGTAPSPERGTQRA